MSAFASATLGIVSEPKGLRVPKVSRIGSGKIIMGTIALNCLCRDLRNACAPMSFVQATCRVQQLRGNIRASLGSIHEQYTRHLCLIQSLLVRIFHSWTYQKGSDDSTFARSKQRPTAQE